MNISFNRFFLGFLIILLTILFILTGCSTAVPVKQKFPEADPIMFTPAPKLDPLPAETQDLDRLITNSTENYGKYRELVQRLEMWKEWYIKQKENYESAYK
jgi:hypothetical protein